MICQYMKQDEYEDGETKEILKKKVTFFDMHSTKARQFGFCTDSQAELFHPYEKHHSTVKDACQIAQELNVRNLLLYHTEDRNLSHRKELYENEGRKYFKGNLFIPNDLETLAL